MKGFKGFDKNLKCRDMQYVIGETATHTGPAVLCDKGLHFVESPLDVFGYYPPADSRFAEVEADQVSDQTATDTKRVAKSLHIKAELSLSALLVGGVKFILDKVDFTNAQQSKERQSAATNTGKYGTAISLGIEGKASGALGNFLVLAEWKYKDDEWKNVAMGLVKVDGENIKANTFYTLRDGAFVEVF